MARQYSHQDRGCETNDEVVFDEPGDMTPPSFRTLGGFGVMVDNIGHRFVATTTIVAATGWSASVWLRWLDDAARN